MGVVAVVLAGPVLAVDEGVDGERQPSASGGQEVTNSELVIVVVVTMVGTVLLKLEETLVNVVDVVMSPAAVLVVVVPNGSTEGA
jgi:hypothetical protein